MDHPLLLRQTLELDAIAAAAGMADRPGTILLDGQRHWHGVGRSALLFDPVATVRASADGTLVWSGGRPWLGASVAAGPQVLAALRRQLPRIPGAHFLGFAGWVSYDLGPARWGVRHPVAPPFDAPDLWLGLYETALVFASDSPPRLLVADLRGQHDAAALRRRAAAAAETLQAAAARPAPAGGSTLGAPSTPDAGWHRRAVAEIHRFLRQGDAYQINLTGFTSARTDRHPWPVFLGERRRNPVPFAAYLNCGELTLTSHSPERLLRQVGRHVETAPIKGTAPAAVGDAARLLASPKDRAEHVMIVDLARNDLGRSCEFGSVRVRGMMEELRLRGLVHLVSRVRGRLRPGAEAQLWEDIFPGGSITGAPKRRAMEIISSIEQTGRGPYTGTIGYCDATGVGDWNIAIRTAVWQDGAVHFGTGGGVVIDSDPAAEYAEAQLKAASFLESLATPTPLLRAGAGS